jgi:hypothetical protein
MFRCVDCEMGVSDKTLKRTCLDPLLFLPRKRRKVSLADDSLNYEGFELARMSAPEKNGEDLEALEALVLACVMHRMAQKGLDPGGIINGILFRNKKRLTALELCELLKLLKTPLLVSADCVESFLASENRRSSLDLRVVT